MKLLILSTLILALVSQHSASNHDKYDIIILGGGSSGFSYLYKILSLYGFSLDNPSVNPQYKFVKILVLNDGQDESDNPDIQLSGVPNFISLSTRKSGNHGPFYVFASREESRQEFIYRRPQVNGGIPEVGASVLYYPVLNEIEEWSKYTSLNVSQYWNYSSVFKHFGSLESFSDPLHADDNLTNPSYYSDIFCSSNRGNSGPMFVMKNNAINDTNLIHLNNAFSTLGEFIQDINAINLTSRIGLSETDRPFKFINSSYASKSSIYRTLKNLLPSNVKIEDRSTAFGIKKSRHGNDRLSLSSIKVKKVLYQKDGVCREAILKNNGRIILAMGITASSKFVESIGIGDCSYLESLGISCVKNSPDVGQHFRDHSYFLSTHRPISGIPGFNLEDRNAGIMSLWGNDDVLNPSSSSSSSSNNTSSSSNDPNNEQPNVNPHPSLATWRLSYLMSRTGSGIPLLLVVYTNLQPIQEGNIHIQHNDPLYKPLLNLNYTLNNIEGDRYVFMLKKVREILSQNYTELSPGLSLIPLNSSDSQIKSALFSILNTNYHGAGTLAMGKATDPQTLRIYGTENMYCIDPSVYPYPPLTNPLGTILSVSAEIAERHFRMFGR